MNVLRTYFIIGFIIVMVQIVYGSRAAEVQPQVVITPTPYRLVIEFDQGPVEICYAHEFTIETNRDVGFRVSECLPDRIFKGTFE